MLKTSEMIVKSHPYGFKSFIITGDRGIGKSSYGLRVVCEVYRKLGYEPIPAWKESLNSCKFHINDVIDFLRESAMSDECKPVLLWDDVGIHASGSKYFLNMKMVDQLKAVLDTIRTAVSGLVMTCPTTQGLLSILKNYDDYKLIINFDKSGGYNRAVTGYKWRTLPSGKRLIKTMYYDSYSCYLPNWVFNSYMKKRRAALKETLDNLDVSLKKN